MAARFERADEDLRALMFEVVEQFHPDLQEQNVKIDLLLAFGPVDDNGDVMGEAIKVHGLPAAACCRVVNLRDRTKGMGDAEIQIDGDHYQEWSDRQVRALLDHELTHLEIQRDKYGAVKIDDLERPKLSMRVHDRQFGWFDVVARRWGADSWEAQQAKALVTDWEFTQMYLPGFDVQEFGKYKPVAESTETSGGPVRTADGRQISVGQMMDEVQQSFAGAL